MKVAAKVLLFLISWLVWNGYDYGMSKYFLPMPHKQNSKFALKQQFQRPIEKEHSLCRPISRLSSQIVFLHSHLLSCENGRDGTSQVIYWTRKSPNRLPFRLPLLTIWKSPAYSILICWKLQALSIQASLRVVPFLINRSSPSSLVPQISHSTLRWNGALGSSLDNPS